MGGWYDGLHRRDTIHTFDAWLIDGFLGNFLRLFAKDDPISSNILAQYRERLTDQPDVVNIRNKAN